MGERQARLSIKAEAAVLKGGQAAEGNSVEIFDGNVDGIRLSGRSQLRIQCPWRLSFLVRSKAIALAAPLFSAHSALPRFLARARAAHKARQLQRRTLCHLAVSTPSRADVRCLDVPAYSQKPR
jgi:hypothetical protein